MKKLILVVLAMMVISCGSDDNSVSTLSTELEGTWECIISDENFTATMIIKLEREDFYFNKYYNGEVMEVSFGHYITEDDSLYFIYEGSFTKYYDGDIAYKEFSEEQQDADLNKGYNYIISEKKLYIGEGEYSRSTKTIETEM